MTLSPRELSLQSNTDVLGYIRAQNAKRDAQAKAEGWEFWTNMAEDIASEFANVYELELSFARSTYADVYKDWSGIKGYVSDELTLEQVEAAISRLAEWAAEDGFYDGFYDDQAEGWQAELDLLDHDQADPPPEPELEEWEVYEAAAEELGYGA